MFGGTKRRIGLTLGLAASAAALAAVMPAYAADLNGGGSRISRSASPSSRQRRHAREIAKVSLTVSGVVNEALLVWDDGREKNAYVVTNEEQQDRFRFLGEADIAAGWKAGYLIEIGIRGSRGDRVNQDNSNGSNPDGRDGVSTRHSAWWLSSKDYGKLWAGLTSDAADGITEINLANTNHFASSNKQYLGDSGNNGFFALHNGQRSNIKWGLFASPPGLAQQPGEGHRENLIKYETPTYAGFVASTSWGEDDLWNIALRYKGEFSGFKLAAGIAYSEVNGGKCDEYSARHRRHQRVRPQRLAAAYRVWSLRRRAPTAISRTSNCLRGSIRRPTSTSSRPVSSGSSSPSARRPCSASIGTSIAAPVTSAEALQAANVPGVGAGFVGGTSLEGWGLGLNQNFSDVFDLYLLYNHVSADFNVVTASGAQVGKVDVDDFDYVVGGAQIKF